MSEIADLRARLAPFRTEEWAAHALAALNDPEMTFTGQIGHAPGTRAVDLLRIYRLRLEHARKIGLQCWGIEHLLDVLHGKSPSEVILGKPFSGPANAVFAFFEPTGDLIACVTVQRAQKAGPTDEEAASLFGSN